MPTDPTFLVYCAVFDDGDIVPTVVVGEYRSFGVEEADELREAAMKEYGRDAPDHAIFWHAAPA